MIHLTGKKQTKEFGKSLPKVTLYSKKGCHLCEIAKEKLIKIRKEFPFYLEEKDIEDDIALFKRYKYLIPVIEIGLKTVYTNWIDENELKKLLLTMS